MMQPDINIPCYSFQLPHLGLIRYPMNFWVSISNRMLHECIDMLQHTLSNPFPAASPVFPSFPKVTLHPLRPAGKIIKMGDVVLLLWLICKNDLGLARRYVAKSFENSQRISYSQAIGGLA